MAIIEVIAGNMIQTENYLLLPEIYLDSNTKTLKNYGKKMGPLPFLSPVESPERKERGPRRDGSGSGARSRRSYLGPRWRRRRRERLSHSIPNAVGRAMQVGCGQSDRPIGQSDCWGTFGPGLNVVGDVGCQVFCPIVLVVVGALEEEGRQFDRC